MSHCGRWLKSESRPGTAPQRVGRQAVQAAAPATASIFSRPCGEYMVKPFWETAASPSFAQVEECGDVSWTSGLIICRSRVQPRMAAGSPVGAGCSVMARWRVL